MSILAAILEWSESRPEWQRDTLRRLVASPELSSADLDELLALCKRPHDNVEADVQARPLLSEHLPDSDVSVPAVRLLEISSVRGVNVLAGERPLKFAPEGLTIIFGQNGAGKSGYVRILKQVCRARGDRPEILPNVYDDSGNEESEASLRYLVGGEERRFTWMESGAPPAELGQVSTFDHECASVYVDNRCDIAYLPFGLDLLPRLADVCEELRERLAREIKELDAHALDLPDAAEGSVLADVLGSLDEPDAEEVLAREGTFDEEDADRLRGLEVLLAEQTPERRAAELEGAAGRLVRFADQFTELATATGERAAEALGALIEKAETARAAVRLASAEAFDGEPLPNTGSAPWRVLWAAARDYASVGPDLQFPPAEGDLCPLCQRAADRAVAERFRRFDAFIRSDVGDRASRAQNQLQGFRQGVRSAPSPVLESVGADLAPEHEDLLRALDSATRALEDRRDGLLGAESSEALGALPSLPAVERLIGRVLALHEELEAKAAEHRGLADASRRGAAEAEAQTLRDRRRVTELREPLLREVERRRRRRALVAARRDAATTGVTRKNTELTERFVTAAVRERFSEELTALRLTHLPIRVGGSPGQRGSAFHELELGAARAVRTGQVLSRGEHRCVALAAFLAELATQESASSVVLDDPVSSLDHDRRRHVAERLVEVGCTRPVLIFSHDIVFVLALQRRAEAEGVPLSALQIRRTGHGAGEVSDELPWDGMRTKARIGQLKALHQEAEAIYRRGDRREYERRAREIYGYLREAWERGVEEILLNEALTRYAPEVKTQSLRRLHRLEEQHIGRMEAGMSKTSRWLRGHDDPGEINEPVPEPDEVEADIQELDAWRREVQALHR